MGIRYDAWIGKAEETSELIVLAQVQAAAAMLDHKATEWREESELPPLWHWFFFLPRVPQSQLDADGHPQRGGFMPPIELPRRMFAGARMRFLKPLAVGKMAVRQSTIRNVSEKDGRSGKLAFVTVTHSISQEDEVCLEEEQDIVYREHGPPVDAPAQIQLPPVPEGAWTRTIMPEATLLFRFSALTFNAHRIHYDREYAMKMEKYPGLVVHGPLTAVLLMELTRQHVRQAPSAFSFRGQAPLFDLAPFRLIATPSGDRVSMEAQGPDGKTAMTAHAEL